MAADGEVTHTAAATQPSPPATSILPRTSPTSSPRPSTEKIPVLFNEDESEDESEYQTEEAALRRSTDKGKRSIPGMSAFDRLPDEIVQQILLAVDAGSFASLVLLNSKWRAISQQAHLYAHHLALCPSYPTPTSTKLLADRPLEDLRRTFARQVKRCRFDAYLRPNRTLVRLISNSISSSSCPGGEGMQFQPSPRGHHLLAYNSSRIYVLELQGPTIEVVRELKILRRPAATCIRDDASVLAVLLTEMQVDLYDLKKSPPRRIRSIILDNSPRAIALSPCGSVLAAAYEGGIEVSSLNSDALATDRRAVKCDHVDALAFSFDGTQILGTSVQGAQPHTVILTAPYYDPGSVMSRDDLSALWTTSILFPNTSRDCSHAVLLQDSSREEAFWTFTYDRSFETFRAVRIDDLRNGTTYFTGPVPTTNSPARLLPCTIPSASYHGDLVSAAFQGKEIWLYGVPEDLDAVPTMGNGAVAELDAGPAVNNAGGSGTGLNSSGSMSRANSGSPSMRAASARLQDSGNDSSVRVPQWQLLCDRLQNTFIAGCRIGELPGVSMVNWVEGFGASSLRERLVVGARGISEPKPITFDEDDMDFIDGGRLLLIDFDYGVSDGKTTEIDIEVGSKEPEVLEEEHRDIEAEVAIVRRRTVAQKKGKTGTLMRNATTAGVTPSMPPPPLPTAMTFSPTSSSRQPHLPFATSSLRNNAAATSDEERDDDPLIPRRIHPSTMLARNQAGVPTPGTLPPLPESSRDATTAAARTTSGEISDEDDGGETESILEEQMAYDAPYSHASPRSGMTLRRAATAAAVNRRLNPPPATTATGAPIAYRRADGRREHPHESDADNWVPPPPPYQAEVDPQDLPVFLRHNVPPVLAPLNPLSPMTIPGVLSSMTPATPIAIPATISTIPGIGATLGAPGLSGLPENSPAPSAPGSVHGSVSGSVPGTAPGSRANSRPTSRQSQSDTLDVPAGDMYEATPPATPQPAAVAQPTQSQVQEVSPVEAESTPAVEPAAVEPAVAESTESAAAEAAEPAETTATESTEPLNPEASTVQRRPSTAQSSPTGNLADLSSFSGFNMNWGNFTPAQESEDISTATFVPKPMSTVQTWPVRQPSVSGRGSVSHNQTMAGPSSPESAVPSLAIPGFVDPQSGYPYSAPVQYGPMSGMIPPGPLSAGFARPPGSSGHAGPSNPPGSSGSHGSQASQGSAQPTSFSVPRVPVGSYRPKRASISQSHLNNTLPMHQPMQPQFQPQQQPQQFHIPDPAMYEFQQLQHQHQQFPQLQQPQPYFLQDPPPRAFSNPVVSSSSPLVEDQPLIISTPRGVTGAFDPPPRQLSKKGRYNHSSSRSLDDIELDEPKILAPVPRHANRHERSAELRERLETISGGGTPAAPLPKPMINPFYQESQAPSQLGRKQSRAERSAAKNMADAKKRWGRKDKRDKGKSVDGSYMPTVSSDTVVPDKDKKKGKSVAVSTVPSAGPSGPSGPAGKHKLTLGNLGKKKKRKDHDAASSVWTDVTATTGMPQQGGGGYYQSSQAQYYGGMPSIPGGGPGSSSAYAMQQLQQHMAQTQQQTQTQSHPLQQSQQAPATPTEVAAAAYAGSDKKGKCVVM